MDPALNLEVKKCGLKYRQPPTPRDGNCLFHAFSDQLKRLRMTPRTASQLRSDVVEFLRSNPNNPEGVHLREFVPDCDWEGYLNTMANDCEWATTSGEVAVRGLANMCNIHDVAIVSSLGEKGMRIISPGVSQQSTTDLSENMVLLGHEAGLHYHSLEPQLPTQVTEDKDKVIDQIRRRFLLIAFLPQL